MGNNALDYVVLSLASTPIATMLVSGYKLARPAASSLSIFLTALLTGIFTAFLIAAAQGLVTLAAFSLQLAAVVIIAGLLSGGVAAGIRATDKSADDQRV